MRFISIMSTVIFLISACTKPGDFEVTNLNNNLIMVLGHGGMGDLYHYPKNSKISIETVIGIGADGSEVNIQMTKDSVLVLFHDVYLSQNTNGNGKISEITWDDLSKLRYKNTDIQVYSFDQLLSDYENQMDIYFSLDIKRGTEYYDDSLTATLLRSLKKTLDEHNFSDRIFIEGDAAFLTKVQGIGINSKLFVTFTNYDNLLNQSISNDYFGIGISSENITLEQVTKAHENGKFIMMWSVISNLSTESELKKGPDIIQADKPIYALMLMERFNYSYKIP